MLMSLCHGSTLQVLEYQKYQYELPPFRTIQQKKIKVSIESQISINTN